MNPRTPLRATIAIAAAIHLAALITHHQYGLKTALNFLPPAAGSLLAIWLIRIADQLTPTPPKQRKNNARRPTREHTANRQMT